MKIWGEIPKIFGLYEKQKSVDKVQKTSGIVSKKDVISISNQAKDFQTALKAVREAPDVRQDKVDEIRAKVTFGSYDIEGNLIADKIIKSMLDKKV